MYFIETKSGEFVNLFGLLKWYDRGEYLRLVYPNKVEIILNGIDAKNVRKCLLGFVVHFPQGGQDEKG